MNTEEQMFLEILLDEILREFNPATQHFVRMTAYVFLTVEWKHLDIAIVR